MGTMTTERQLPRSSLSFADAAVALLVVAAAITLPFLLPTPVAADKALVRTPGSDRVLSLSKDRVIEVRGLLGPATIQVKDGAVRMLRCTSPNDSRHRAAEGWARSSGDSLICAPNRVYVTLLGGEHDAVIR